uniref:Uncharacterized protein n=1 Tax=Anopheles maculatus TaxID=74869 RepID=A0A182SVD1_9DIPT
MLVNSTINSGQLIPLESLLQKPGITGAANNSTGINTILKLAGTTKTGQQFLQFGTESFRSGSSIIVANKKGNLGEINATTAESNAAFLSHIASSPTAKLVQQGTKQQSSVFSSKTSLPSTVNVSGEFLNAKIIGVHNIGTAKVKGASSLSLMNANSLNIAHIGGKPIIIANNSSIGTNQAITVSTAHLSTNSGTTKSSPSSPMMFTANSNSSSHVMGQPNACNVNVSTAATGREIARTNVVSGIPGQIQTVLLRNNLLKVQTVPSTTPNKLSQQQSVASGTVGTSGIASGISATAGSTLIATTSDRCTTVQSKPSLQQQQKLQKQQQTVTSGGTTVILTPNISTSNITIGGTVVEANAEMAIRLWVS